jgi:hypothetical protein|tara:strand:+ start:4473 stop:4934 length:462 start_codon:yes stop_codon:yes gene_type:complete
MALTDAERSKKWREKNPDYDKEWKANNPEKRKKATKKWREKNPNHSKEWKVNNSEHVKKYRKEWNKNNRGKRNALNSKRRAAKLQAAPSWANKKTIDMIYIIANICNKTVDHIVPLQSSVVCGLHWEANLQLLTQQENSSKSNKHDFDTPLGR